MELLRGETPRETAIAWGFVAGQAVLLGVIVLAPAGDAWLATGLAASAGQALEWLGIAVLLVGLVSLGRSLTPLPTPVPHGQLRTGGLYRLVRHPIYSGVLALAAGASIRSGSVVVAVASAGLCAWFMAKARWEEGRLRARYPGYDVYAAATPRFVPGWPFGTDRR